MIITMQKDARRIRANSGPQAAQFAALGWIPVTDNASRADPDGNGEANIPEPSPAEGDDKPAKKRRSKKEG